MRPKDCASAVLLIETLDDMLLKSIIGSSLWRGSVDVTAIRIFFKFCPVPRFNRIRWIGEDDIKLPQLVLLQKCGMFQSVSANDLKIFYAMQKHVHSRNSRCHQVKLLSV